MTAPLSVTIRRTAASTAAHWTPEQPAEVLAWAMGTLGCGYACLHARWSGGDHAKLHRSVEHGAQFVADGIGAQLHPFTTGGRQRRVTWAQVDAFLGDRPGPDVRAHAAAVASLHGQLLALPSSAGKAELDFRLRVVAAEAWHLLRPGLLRAGSGGALFELVAAP